MKLDERQREQISGLITSGEVVLFMKGARHSPQCGFSAAVVDALDGFLGHYETIDVLTDPELRENLKVYSDWPTIPQLYVKGEFVGGADIVRQLDDDGELAEALGVDLSKLPPPELTITDAAAEQIREALADAVEDEHLRLAIDARYFNDLSIAGREQGDLEIVSNGVTLLLDLRTANRANGLTIDFVEDARGAGFRIENPNAPPQVKDMTVQELAERLRAGAEHVYDVRTPQEIETARIAGARAFDEAALAELESLPRDTPLIFHCHHGGRSRRAAEQFLGMGFSDVSNVVGGIDAWSREIDPDVPTY